MIKNSVSWLEKFHEIYFRPKIWFILMGLTLIIASILIYLLHYHVFHDSHHIFIYMLGDLAFVPIEVLLVSVIVHRLLINRDKQHLFKKLNMIIGSFYSEAGIDLIQLLSEFDNDFESTCTNLICRPKWQGNSFLKKHYYHIKKYDHKLKFNDKKVSDLRRFLTDKRSYFLGILENPNILEHDDFTNLFLAVFHLTEELNYRIKIENLPEKDKEHLLNDIKRVYSLLIAEWLVYLEHLKDAYPYLYSLYSRLNPFDSKSKVEIK